jgi:AmmeMemoRadiSam system protein B
MSDRPPAVAGRFYPGDPARLTALVDRLLSAVPGDPGGAVAPADASAVAYVVPHAGYRYSGPTAAHVYARLRTRPRPPLVVLLGPAHYVPVHGCAVPAAQRWLTPLGAVPVAVEAIRALGERGTVTVGDAPFVPEHSLEVQLPFLQRCWDEPVPVLPMAVGLSTVDGMADTLGEVVAAAGPAAVLLCSTDLSHYLPQPAALEQDTRTIEAVSALAAERIGARDACGVFALRGLVGWARRRGLAARLLHRSTSADSGADPGRVVGYAAFSLS